MLPLFRGVSPVDQQLSPLGDLKFEIGKVLPQDTPFRIQYRVTPDMTVDFRVTFTTTEGLLSKETHVEIGGEAQGSTPLPPLCTVNAV